MTRSITIFAAIFMAGIFFFSEKVIAQTHLEVDGKAKILIMDKNNNADSIVVRLSDGTLAVRDAFTLFGLSTQTGNYGTVVNPMTGKVWLDRNLGATQVATSSIDPDSFGDLYQWGRGADGHQLRISDTTHTQATDWLSGSGVWNGQFITGSSFDFDWLSTAETHMWSGTDSENNPCPSGFRIPTIDEWNQERSTWTSIDAAGAYASPLKLPLAGYRYQGDGTIENAGDTGDYWSKTVIDTRTLSHIFLSNSSYNLVVGRARGCSIRCIKD